MKTTVFAVSCIISLIVLFATMMPSRQPAKKRNCRKTICSTYANLPEDLLERIIPFLPIKSAVSSSLVSKRFKNSWRSTHDLCFDKNFEISRDPVTKVMIISHIIRSNSCDKVQKFSLHINPIDTAAAAVVVEWIKKVTAKDVESLDLDFSPGKSEYRIPFFLIDVESIRVLKLNFVELHNIPQKFNFLGLLRKLVLNNIRPQSTKEVVKTFLSNCPVLEELVLIKCKYDMNLEIKGRSRFKIFRMELSRPSSVTIDAPALRLFHYHGKLCDIKFQCRMVHLNDVILKFYTVRNCQNISGMKDIMASLSHVKVLTFCSHFLEGLSQKSYSVSGDLKEFQLCIGWHTVINPYDIAYLLTKCPYLEKLIIDFRGQSTFAKGLDWKCNADKEKFNQCQPSFGHLKFVKLTGIRFEYLEFELVKFFLRNARFLEKLDFVSRSVPQPNPLMDAITSNKDFLPASPAIKIEFHKFAKDASSIHLGHSMCLVE